MPNRILRDWTDSLSIAALSPEAERFFVRLIMKADDFGRFHGDQRLLKAALFPLLPDVRLAKVRQWRDECVTADLTALYQDERGREFLEIKRFNQRTRAKESKFPPPSDKCQQFAVIRPSNGSHVRTETETDTETIDGDGIMSSNKLDDAKSVLEYLNKKTEKDYRPVATHLDLIRARLKEPGVDVEGAKQMIDSKCSEWLRDAEMSKYLRPKTLFAKGNFSSYYDERNVKPKRPPTCDTGPPKPKKLNLPEPGDWKERVPEQMAERGWGFLCTNDHDMAKRLHNGENFNIDHSFDFEEAMKEAGFSTIK